jgi:hypothetical protein
MKNRLFMLDLAILAATIFASSAHAQRHVASAQASRPRMNLARRPGERPPVVPSRRSRRFSSGSGFAPYFYSDYDSDSGIIEVPTHQNVERTAQPASPAPVPPPHQSLLLELHGDHWVRITNYGQSQTDGQSSEPEPQQAYDLPSATPSNAPRRIPTAEAPSELPPAVLVFRDGHREEIGKYVIVASTIYTSADHWSIGSWTRKVQIVQLDVPATLKLNQERGTKFSLPSGPNEVMIRP